MLFNDAGNNSGALDQVEEVSSQFREFFNEVVGRTLRETSLNHDYVSYKVKSITTYQATARLYNDDTVRWGQIKIDFTKSDGEIEE